MIAGLGIVVWLLCSALAYARILDYWQGCWLTIEQRRRTAREDVIGAAVLALFGPISIAMALLATMDENCGYTWWPPKGLK